MPYQNTCHVCDPSNEGFTWKCAGCLKVHHMHWEQWPHEYPNSVVLIPCPSCRVTNGIRKPGPSVIVGIKISKNAYTPRLVDIPVAAQELAAAARGGR